jgi:hypothetical protein
MEATVLLQSWIFLDLLVERYRDIIFALFWSFFQGAKQMQKKPQMSYFMIFLCIRALLIAYQLQKYFLSTFSWADIYLNPRWAYQITLGSPVPGPIFSTRCRAAWDSDVTLTVDMCCLLQKIACGLLSAKYKYILLAAGNGCLRIEHRWTDYVVWVQLLIFAVVYAVWGTYVVRFCLGFHFMSVKFQRLV